METDLDTKVSRDISVRQGNDNRMGSYWSATNSNGNVNSGSVYSSKNSRFPLSSTSKLPNDRANIDYKYFSPPVTHQNRLHTHGEPSDQYGIRSENQYYGHQGNPFGRQPMASNSTSWRNNFAGDQKTRPNDQFELYGSKTQPSDRSTFGPGLAANFNEVNKLPHASFSKDRIHPSSVRDVKKRELSRRSPGDYQLDDTRYSVLRRSRSLPRVDADKAGFQDLNHHSISEKTRRKSLVYLPSKKKLESSSAMQRLFPSRENTDVKSYRNEVKHSQSTGALSNTENAINGSQSELSGQFTRNLQGDQKDQFKTRAVMGPSPNNESHRIPKFSKTENSFRPLFTTYDPAAIRNVQGGKTDKANTGTPTTEAMVFDDSTIDKALFDLPKPVEIPERYIPDSSDEDEALSFEEKLRRKEKADQIKKIIAKQSLQDFSQGELTLQTGPVHDQVNDETRRREQILDVKRSLAQAVMLRSKEDAALRRKDWSAQDGLSNSR